MKERVVQIDYTTVVTIVKKTEELTERERVLGNRSPLTASPGFSQFLDSQYANEVIPI